MTALLFKAHKYGYQFIPVLIWCELPLVILNGLLQSGALGAFFVLLSRFFYIG